MDKYFGMIFFGSVGGILSVLFTFWLEKREAAQTKKTRDEQLRKEAMQRQLDSLQYRVSTLELQYPIDPNGPRPGDSR